MIGRVLGGLEVLAVVVAALAIARFSTGDDPDLTTAGMVALVTLVWLAYRIALWRWFRDRAWLGGSPVPGSLPPELAAAADRVEASTVEYAGKRWRTASAAVELGPDGAGTGSHRLPALLGSGQGVLISLGLIGTFLGLSIGLYEAVPKMFPAEHADSADVRHTEGTAGAAVASVPADPLTNMKGGMKDLLGGARLAFAKSVAGVAFAMLWGLRLRHAETRRDDYLDGVSDELDRRWPLLTPQQLQLHVASEITRTNTILAEIAQSAAAESTRTELERTS